MISADAFLNSKSDFKVFLLSESKEKVVYCSMFQVFSKCFAGTRQGIPLPKSSFLKINEQRSFQKEFFSMLKAAKTQSLMKSWLRKHFFSAFTSGKIVGEDS